MTHFHICRVFPPQKKQLVFWDSLFKTVKVKTGTELFWQEEKRTKNCWNLF